LKSKSLPAPVLNYFATDNNARSLGTDLLRMLPARRHGKDLPRAICNWLIVLPNNEDAVEHKAAYVLP
jgi:hypothetical protein